MGPIDQFVADLAATRPSDNNTPRTYQWATQVFASFLAERPIPLASFGPAQFDEFAKWVARRVHPDGRKWAPRSVRTVVKGTKAFLEWAAKRGLAPAVALGHPDLPKVPDEDAPHLDRAGLGRFFDALAEEQEPLRTAVALLPLTGCRVREVCTAPLAGVTTLPDKTAVICVRRKGSSIAIEDMARYQTGDCLRLLSPVGLSDQALATVQTYLGSYRIGISGSPWLFPSTLRAYDPISPDTVRKVVRRLGVVLGMDWLTTHRAGRHTLGALLREDGVPIDRIADALGHKSSETTRRTYARATPGEVARNTTHAQKG